MILTLTLWLQSFLDWLFPRGFGFGDIVVYRTGTGAEYTGKVTDVDYDQIQIRVYIDNKPVKIWVHKNSLKHNF